MALHPRIAIIGAGFSGSMLAVQLVNQATSPLTLHLIDGSGKQGRGAAYSTWDAHHLLNVPAAKMSAFEDRPRHLLDWLETKREHWQEALPALEGYEYDGESFLPRQLYGLYLDHIVHGALAVAQEKNITVEWHGQDAAALSRMATGAIELTLVDGTKIEADKAVLATGNPPARALPASAGLVVQNFWSEEGRNLAESRQVQDFLHPVAIIGTGLTMVDAVISLHNAGINVPVIAISRHGKLPTPHDLFAKPGTQSPPPGNLKALFRWLREQDKNNWRGVIDGLRPHTVNLWQKLTVKERNQFMRHLFGWWNIHRHRMPASSHQLLAQLQERGRFTLVAGRALRVEGNTLLYRRRGNDKEEALLVSGVINCTGPELQLSKINNPLLKALAEQKLIIPHPTGIGLSLGEDGSAKGPLQGRLYAMGPLLIGEYLETTAVPELRQQAEALATRILASL